MAENTNIDWPAIHKRKWKEYTEYASYYEKRGESITAANFRKLAELHGEGMDEIKTAETTTDNDKGYTAKRVLALAVFLIVLAALILGLGIPQ